MRPNVLSAALTLGTALLLASAAAQTAAPAKPATPATPAKGVSSAATTKAVSALSIEVSRAVGGRILSCPDALKLSPRAVCLYSTQAQASLRPLLRGKLGARAQGEWKTTGKSNVLLVSEAAGAPVAAFVLLSPISDKETLVVVDAAQATATPAAKVSVPAGVTRGQPYVLGSDLAGVVSVASLGGGKYRLSADDNALTVTVGQRSAQTSGGAVELPLAPATDGKNLIFPVSGLRALGCTVTPAGGSLTVACGSDSVGLKPIVF
ncbi:hypothetical protein [Deinococcus arcticus]|uniref:Uncharacterized protein n=1 Tax=Deinococcus arcticus TaxID=2136176 RepID=A0A2T3W857_9DEIO|nr:hypothetical protein [Deinococcus arcticus]PTA68100.1 hypothetical protein C8263_08465 [Deinococcus arcticus]